MLYLNPSNIYQPTYSKIIYLTSYDCRHPNEKNIRVKFHSAKLIIAAWKSEE